MKIKRMNLRMFEADTQIIDRSGADTLIPEDRAREIIQGVVTQSAVLSRGRRLPNMSSRTYRMPVLDMLPIAYFVNGDTGQKKTTKMAWDKKMITAEEIAAPVRIKVDTQIVAVQLELYFKESERFFAFLARRTNDNIPPSVIKLLRCLLIRDHDRKVTLALLAVFPAGTGKVPENQSCIIDL